MTQFDAMTMVTLARLKYLVPGTTSEDYASALLSLHASIAEDVLSAEEVPEGTARRTRNALNDTPIALAALASILTSVARTDEERENVLYLLVKAIDDSLNLGAFYMAGRPKEDLPPPITAEQIAKINRDKSSRGGKVSVEKRQAKIKEGWHKHARELALVIRGETPGMTQKDLAGEIRGRWKLEGPIPGIDSVLTFVAAEEKAKRIPRRKV